MPVPMITIERGPRKKVLTGNVILDDWHISSSNEQRDLRNDVIDIVEKYGKGSAVVMADVVSLRNRKMDISLLKELKTRKIEIWLITYVEDADDLFDAFYMNIDSLFVPYHVTLSDAALKEMNLVSDSTVPLIFTDGDLALSRLGKVPLHDILQRVEKMGFSSVAVMDISKTYNNELWTGLFAEYDRIIPFVRGDDAVASLENLGFVNIVQL